VNKIGYRVVITCRVENETEALEVIGRVAEYSGAVIVCAEIEKIEDD